MVLQLEGLRKRYGRQVAVRSLDLELRAHEFMTFLGPSGSGKTTTLMMVAGLQSPDAGSILLNGKPVDALPPYRRDLGMVFQNYALFPHMTVARNLAFPLEMRRMSRAETEPLVADMLRLIGLPDHGERLPKELSGGQQQRVALGRAMIYRPSLLLMDEPLGALDKKLRVEMQGEIKRIHRERHTSVLYVTHDQEEALTMSDRIAVFNNGGIEQVGTPEDVYERPATRFVAGFIGETNFFPVQAISKELGHLRLLSNGVPLRCRADSVLPPGDELVVAVRPERVRLLADVGERVGFAGTIADVVYLGTMRRATVQLHHGGTGTALMSAQSWEASGLALGQTVILDWDADHGTIFGADESALPDD